MNKEIMKKFGFGKEVEAIENGQCPFCAKEIVEGMFRDKLSLQEFHISGLCQECQDKTFG